MDLEATGPESTRVVWAGSLGLTGLMRLVEPLFAGEIRAGEAAELVRLKERARGGTGRGDDDVMTTLSRFPISARSGHDRPRRARRWYEERLGLVPEHEDPGGCLVPLRRRDLAVPVRDARRPGPPRTRSRAGRSRTSSR